MCSSAVLHGQNPMLKWIYAQAQSEQVIGTWNPSHTEHNVSNNQKTKIVVPFRMHILVCLCHTHTHCVAHSAMSLMESYKNVLNVENPKSENVHPKIEPKSKYKHVHRLHHTTKIIFTIA